MSKTEKFVDRWLKSDINQKKVSCSVIYIGHDLKKGISILFYSD